MRVKQHGGGQPPGGFHVAGWAALRPGRAGDLHGNVDERVGLVAHHLLKARVNLVAVGERPLPLNELLARGHAQKGGGRSSGAAHQVSVVRHVGNRLKAAGAQRIEPLALDRADELNQAQRRRVSRRRRALRRRLRRHCRGAAKAHEATGGALVRRVNRAGAQQQDVEIVAHFGAARGITRGRRVAFQRVVIHHQELERAVIGDLRRTARQQAGGGVGVVGVNDYFSQAARTAVGAGVDRHRGAARAGGLDDRARVVVRG